MRPTPPITTTWEEGRFFDLWMIVHFLSGLSGGLSNVFLGLSTVGVYALGASLLVAWELVELARGIRETWENRALDLVVGVAGIAAAQSAAARLDPTWEYAAFGVSAVAFMFGTVRGWLAYRARVRRAPAASPAG
jgi:hypothetical protein